MWFNMEDSVNLLTMIGSVITFGLTAIVAWGYVKKMKDSKQEGVLAEENWDGIGEYKNDLPMGWTLFYIGFIVWGLWYWFIGFPLNAYSQIGEWNEETKEYQAKFERKWQNADKDTLVAMGESIYLVQCASCHGVTADGMGGNAQNLVTWGKEDWITSFALKGSGMDNEGNPYIMARLGGGYPAMPAQDTTLEAIYPGQAQQKAEAAAAYIVETFTPGKAKNAGMVSEGQEVYATVCAACHGADGKGMMGVAPGLGDTLHSVLQHGLKGNIGMMPAFQNRFVDVQKDALNEYIYSLN